MIILWNNLEFIYITISNLRSTLFYLPPLHSQNYSTSTYYASSPISTTPAPDLLDKPHLCTND